MTIYRPTAKALKRTWMTDDHRLWLRGDGSAIMWEASTLKVVQSDLLYRRKDSHITDSGEAMPAHLIFEAEELRHCLEHNMSLPVDKVFTVIYDKGQTILIEAVREKTND